MAFFGVLVAGVGSWFAYGRDAMSRDQIESLVLREITRAPYPWLEDRGLVMHHISNGTVHEGDAAKRARIREEVQAALRHITVRLHAMTETLEDLKSAVNKQP